MTRCRRLANTESGRGLLLLISSRLILIILMQHRFSPLPDYGDGDDDDAASLKMRATKLSGQWDSVRYFVGACGQGGGAAVGGTWPGGGEL